MGITFGRLYITTTTYLDRSEHTCSPVCFTLSMDQEKSFVNVVALKRAGYYKIRLKIWHEILNVEQSGRVHAWVSGRCMAGSREGTVINSII